jgi:hypothetical protein
MAIALAIGVIAPAPAPIALGCFFSPSALAASGLTLTPGANRSGTAAILSTRSAARSCWIARN